MNSNSAKQKLPEYVYLFDVTDTSDDEGSTERFSISVLATSFVDAYNNVRLASPSVDSHIKRKVTLRSIVAYVRPVTLAPIAPPAYPVPSPYVPQSPIWVTS